MKDEKLPVPQFFCGRLVPSGRSLKSTTRECGKIKRRNTQRRTREAEPEHGTTSREARTLAERFCIQSVRTHAHDVARKKSGIVGGMIRLLMLSQSV